MRFNITTFRTARFNITTIKLWENREFQHYYYESRVGQNHYWESAGEPWGSTSLLLDTRSSILLPRERGTTVRINILLLSSTEGCKVNRSVKLFQVLSERDVHCYSSCPILKSVHWNLLSDCKSILHTSANYEIQTQHFPFRNKDK